MTAEDMTAEDLTAEDTDRAAANAPARKRPWGLLAAAMAVCCSAPFLVGTGLAAAVAGIGLGSWLLVGAAIAVVLVAVSRLGRRSARVGGRSEHDDDNC